MALAHEHAAKITKGTATGRPYHVQCACGTAGDFATKQAAKGFINGHFKILTGINTKSLKDETPDSFAPEPVTSAPAPSAHVGGVGVMPASHAAVATTKAPPPPPPPPPPPNK